MADYYCKCKGCRHVDPNERSGYKWYCTWYRSYEDPDPADSLEDQISQLPPEIQTVIRLRFYEQLSLAEIAETTGWNLSTVKTRLYSGLKKLRIAMEGEDV